MKTRANERIHLLSSNYCCLHKYRTCIQSTAVRAPRVDLMRPSIRGQSGCYGCTGYSSLATTTARAFVDLVVESALACNVLVYSYL